MNDLKKVKFEQLSDKFTTISNENLTAIVAGARMCSLMSDTDTTTKLSSLLDDTDNPPAEPTPPAK